jgi:flagellar M-ring protein FliF
VADANLPAEDAEQPAANADNAIRGQESSQSRNYEMDRRVKYVIDPAPRMRRLTVGIAINDAIAQAQTTTAPARRPIPDTELTRLTSLVQGAVGFNSARGDIVNIISTSFEPPRAETPLPIWQQPRYLELAQYISVALAIALLALLVVRPVINRITHIPQTELSREQMLVALSQKGVDVSTLSGSTDGAAGALSDAASADNVDGAAANESKEGDVELREGETLEELKARLKPRKKTAISAEMLDTANSYDDKVTVVRMMVSQDAKRVALVLKNLITKDIR